MSQDILVYGSLKQGHWNHARFSLGEPSWTGIISGFRLINLGAYPAALPAPNDSILCERYTVSDEIFHFIDMMERGAGYTPLFIDNAVLWVYRLATPDETECMRDNDGVFFWDGNEPPRQAVHNWERETF